ncbi:hypothetical protein ACIBF1_45050 [Spirillospora sp. NPDC050679]
MASRIGDLFTYALAPRRIAVKMVDRNERTRQGIAFGVLVAKVDLTKRVVRRDRPADTFTIKITDSAGDLVGSAATGASATAATGAQNVLAGVPSVDYTFQESAGRGTDPSRYTTAWSCEDDGAPVKAEGGRLSRKVPVKVGSHVHCTVTNTGPARPVLKVTKSADPAVARPGRRVRFSFRITNTGNATARAARAVDDLSPALRYARYNGDARASAGTVRRRADTLVWTGDLKPGRSAVVTYSMTVRKSAADGARLNNSVRAVGKGTNCSKGSRDRRCHDRTSTLIAKHLK